jgi:23S rRNA pseudouridine2457 synthase
MKSTLSIKFYKPYGVISSFTSPDNHPTLKDFIPLPDVYPAGRLDHDSEGLLILSNDGKLIQRIINPDTHMPKTYLVQVEGVPQPENLQQLKQGVPLPGGEHGHCDAMVIPEPILPERSPPITPHGTTGWLRVILHEGKKRQIRHMTARVGLPTLRIVRIAIGNVTLAGLQPGEWKYLTNLQ